MAKDAEKKSKKENKHFFKDFKAELKKVIWPTTRQVANNTIAVITIVLITAVIVFALDLIFKAINTYGIDNIRNLVKSENTIQDATVEEDNTENEAGVEGENAETESKNQESANPDETVGEGEAQENIAEDNNIQE